MAQAATNWIPNPSFETNTDGWVTSQVTESRITSSPYSGDYSLELTYSGPFVAYIQLEDWVAVSEGQSVYVSMHALARQDDTRVGVEVLWRDEFDNDLFSAHAVSIFDISTDEYDWTTVSDQVEAPPDSAKCLVMYTLETIPSTTVGDKWILDGFELRIDEPLDGYFDGDTQDCEWVGTPHASASIRHAIDFVFAQDHETDTFDILYRTWSVDEDLNDDVELTEWVDGGVIKVNTEDDIKRSANFEFKNLSVLNPFVTRLKVYMEKYVENTLIFNEPLGVFSIEMPDGTVTYEHRYGTVETLDISSELADSARGKQFVYAKGKNIVGNAEDRITAGRGMKAKFPASSRVFSKTEKFPPWMGDLELVNTLLEKDNFMGCYGDGNGVIVTRKIKKLSQIQPVIRIDQHQVMSLTETNDTERLCNVVKVYKENPDDTPIFAIVKNEDEADPVSIYNMRYKALIISDSEVEDAGDAYELAGAKLEEGKSFDKTLVLEIAPTPYLGIGNVADLEFDMEDGTCYCGRYWVREWELPLAAPFWMKVTLNRVQKFHAGFPED